MAMTTMGNAALTTTAPRLLLAMDLGRRQWVLGFTIGVGQSTRRRTVAAAKWFDVADEIASAKKRFGLPADAPVISCYEAGADGFWLHRYLQTLGVTNLVVDSGTIEVNRRARRAKTDRLDVEHLLALLVRYTNGEHTALRAVHVPTEDDEQHRQINRELLALKSDRLRVTNRIGALLITQGIRGKVRLDFPKCLARVVTWNGQPLADAFRLRVMREWEKVELLTAQIKAVQRARRTLLSESQTPAVAQVQQLRELRGIGETAAWLFVMELFSWRGLKNRRQVGAITGLVPLPHQSGSVVRDRGIGKTGNRAVRAIAVQMAWVWLQRQPQSALSQWYEQRFAHGGPRSRKIGIVAVARRLMIDLWRYVDAGVIPPGAVFKVSQSG
jgi:transposase